MHGEMSGPVPQISRRGSTERRVGGWICLVRVAVIFHVLVLEHCDIARMTKVGQHLWTNAAPSSALGKYEGFCGLALRFLIEIRDANLDYRGISQRVSDFILFLI